jgi:hypothetical protein
MSIRSISMGGLRNIAGRMKMPACPRFLKKTYQKAPFLPLVFSAGMHGAGLCYMAWQSAAQAADKIQQVPPASAEGLQENNLTKDEAMYYRLNLGVKLQEGKAYVDQYLSTGKSKIDFGTYLIATEYYAQHLEPKVYLMPSETLPELLASFETDVETFGEVVKNPALSRKEKLDELERLVHSKSVYDPGAQVLPSLMYVEGGQSCVLRAKYKLAILSRFPEFLEKGERLVFGEYNGHVDFGIYNEDEKAVVMMEFPGKKPYKTWLADLYDPHIFVQYIINYYKASRVNYDRFVVARANKKGPAGEIVIEGPVSPLRFSPQIDVSNSSHAGLLRLRREVGRAGVVGGGPTVEDLKRALTVLKSIPAYRSRMAEEEVVELVIKQLLLLKEAEKSQGGPAVHEAGNLSSVEYEILLGLLLAPGSTKRVAELVKSDDDKYYFFSNPGWLGDRCGPYSCGKTRAISA